MHYIKMILGELKSHRDSLNRSIDKMQREINEAEENQVRNKELRDLVEELMSARTASFAPEEKPKQGVEISTAWDLSERYKSQFESMRDNFVEFVETQNIQMPNSQEGGSFVLWDSAGQGYWPKTEPQPEPEPEPKDPHENDRFGKFKVVDGKMVRVCNCDFCKKRNQRDGQ